MASHLFESMNCFEDSEEENMLISKGVPAVLVRLIDTNQGRLMQWKHQNSFNNGRGNNAVVNTIPNIHADATDAATINGNGAPVVGKTTRFDSAYIPEITIEDYVERVQTYSRCSASVFVIAMVYIDRLIESEGLVVTHLNVHRLFITAFLVAAKFYDDLSFKNAFYATLGGIEKAEMNLLEVDLLNYIKFNLVVPEDVYNAYKLHLLISDNNNAVSPQTVPYSPTSITQSLSFSTVENGPDWDKLAHQEFNAAAANNTVFFVQG